MEKALYGLTPTDVRRLAFNAAEAEGINHSFSKTSKMAGKDWPAGLFGRYHDHSIDPKSSNSLMSTSSY